LMLESATPTMHSTSVASACAIERLLDEPPPDLIHDAAQFVQLARERLVLDNSSMAAAIMFAQPLIKLWQPHWKFAYAVGLNMGIKYTTDGFYIKDIITHLTDEFTLEELTEGESIAMGIFDWGEMNMRTRSFRNALVNVALEHPQRFPAENGSQRGGELELHVLIVDDCEFVRRIHSELVQAIKPGANIKQCDGVDEAIKHVRNSDDAGVPVNLVLLDLNLTLPDVDESTGSPTCLQRVIESSNGMNVSQTLDQASTHVPKDFRVKPFVALISAFSAELMLRSVDDGSMNADGSLNGCDAVVPKPCSFETMRVLIEGAEI